MFASNRSWKLFLLVCSIFASVGESRADTTLVRVTSILVGSDGSVTVGFDAQVTHLVCAATSPKQLTFNLTNSDAAKGQLSALIAAKLSAAHVTVTGTGACTVPSTEEQLAWVRVETN
jgi:hypothetical protein